MSILSFYYALLVVFAITSVVVAPTQSVKLPTLKPAAPGGSLGSLLDKGHLVLGKTWHRVEKESSGEEPSWPHHKALDDVINFEMIEGHLRVAYTRFTRVLIDNKGDSLKDWCVGLEGERKLREYFASNDNYKRVESVSHLTGYWIASTDFYIVSRFLRRFGNCLITPYRNGPVRSSLTLP